MVSEVFFLNWTSGDWLVFAALVVALVGFIRDEQYRRLARKGKAKPRKRRIPWRWVAGVSTLIMLGAITVRWSQLRLPVFLLLAVYIVGREVRDIRRARRTSATNTPPPFSGPPYRPTHRVVDGQVELILVNLKQWPDSGTCTLRGVTDPTFVALGLVVNIGIWYPPRLVISIWYPSEFIHPPGLVSGDEYEATWSLSIPAWGKTPKEVHYPFTYQGAAS